MKSQFSLWYKIFISPQEAMKHAIDNKNKFSIFILLLIYGISVNILLKENILPHFGINLKYIVTLFISSIITGIGTALLSAGLLYVINKTLKYDINFQKLFVVFSWSLAPFLLFLIIMLIFKLYPLKTFIYIFFSIYSLGLLTIGLTKVNQSTFLKSLTIVVILFALNQVSSFFIFKRNIYTDMQIQIGLYKMKNYETPNIIKAVQENNINKVKSLIMNGTNINEKDSFGVSAIFKSQSFEMTKFLIENGVNVNLIINKKMTILNNKRTYHSSYQATKLCFEYGLKDNIINIQNNLKETALHHGDRCSFCEDYTYEDGSENIKLLLQHGANPNIKDYEGETPIFTVRDISKKILMDFGADIFVINDNGETVLFRVKDLELFKLIESKGVDIKHKNKDGKTVFDVTRSEEIRQYLLNK